MKLKYIHKHPDEGFEDEDVLATREISDGYPVPSAGDRMYVADETYYVWTVFHALDREGFPAFDEPDEVHALLVTPGEAQEAGWKPNADLKINQL